MTRQALASLTMTAALALAACSGGGSVVPNPPSSGAMASTTHRTAKATLTIRWAMTKSARDVEAKMRRRPHFVSPSAQSIEIDVTAEKSSSQSSKPLTTIVNKPKSGKLSTVTIDAPIGKDDFVFGVFDRSNAKGTPIGGAELFQKIVAGEANLLKVTLDGYVGGAKLTSNSSLLTSTKDAGGQPNFTLVGTSPATVTLALTDPDGNVIVPPGTTPVSTLTSTQPSLVKVTASGSNKYVVQAVAPNPTAAAIALLVQASSGASGSQQFEMQFPLSEAAIIYAAYGVGGSAGVTVFDQKGDTYTSTGFSGLNTPVAMTWDPVDQFVLIADAGNGGTLLAFDAAGNPAKGWTAPAVPGISGVAYNPDTKQIYVTTTANGGAVKAFNAKGGPVTLGSGAFGGLDNPIGIAYNSSAYANSTPHQIHEFYIINNPSSRNSQGSIPPPFLTIYRSNGVPSLVPVYQLGFSHVPTGVAPIVTNFYGFAAMGCYMTTTTNAVLYYQDNPIGTGSNPPTFGVINTVSGATKLLSIILNPLANYALNGTTTPPGISGPQPVWFYVASAGGGLIAVDGNGVNDTSATFPPPSGASNFVALTMTY